MIGTEATAFPDNRPPFPGRTADGHRTVCPRRRPRRPSLLLSCGPRQLGPAEWWLPTPATGWSLGDQVSHLAYFDGTTLQSLVDPDQFRRDAELLTASGSDFPDRIAAEHRHRSGADLLGWFREARAALVSAYGVRRPAPSAAVVRAGHEPGLVDHGEADGDVGTRPGRRRRGRHRAGNDAAACVTSPIWASAPCRTAMPSTTSRRPWSRSGSSCAHQTGTSGAGGPSTPSIACQAGTPLDFCLVVTQRQAPRRHRPGRDRSDRAAVDRGRAGIRRSGRPRAATAASQHFHGRGASVATEVKRDFV